MITLTQDGTAQRLATPVMPTSTTAVAGRQSADTGQFALHAGSKVSGMRDVLVAADSPESLVLTLRQVRFFVKQFACKVTLVYIAEPADSLANTERLKEKAAKLLGVKANQVVATSVLPRASSVLQIIETANYETVDLIVIPGSFRMGRSYFLWDHSIEEIIRQAPCPVLVVGGKKPLFATS